jgi:hypothetical protein
MDLQIQDDTKLFKDHAKYLNSLDQAIALINKEILSMNTQTELQLSNQETREERTAKTLAKKMENMREIEENNHKKIT